MIDTSPGPEQEESELDLVSRTDARGERKRTEAAWAELVKDLLAISEKQLLKLELGELVERAVLDARRITSGGARNRAMRLIRKELRGSDWVQLRERLEDITRTGVARPASEPTELENWRLRLLDGGEVALAAFVTAYPHAERQRIRQLIRNARKATPESLGKALNSVTEAVRQVLATE